ncbi:MAG: urease accessory protein UreD [Cyanobacteria bacterium REEB67]|nr:urease accessory protein UreD [Cyanobacteria bacterium REEB67]
MINLGVARLTVGTDGEQSKVTDQFSQTPLQLHRPLYLDEQNFPTVYLKSPSSGLLGNDSHVIDVSVSANSTLELRTQAATLVYPGRSSLNVKLQVAERGRLIYLPHPIILGATASLEQRVSIDLGEDATLEYSDTWCVGRIAMAEVWKFQTYDYALEIFQAGRLLFRERWILEPGRMPVQHPLLCGDYTHFAAYYSFGRAASGDISPDCSSFESGLDWTMRRGANTIRRRAYKVS